MFSANPFGCISSVMGGIDWHLTFVVVAGEAMRADGPILPTSK
jgi:hypothetical protein